MNRRAFLMTAAAASVTGTTVHARPVRFGGPLFINTVLLGGAPERNLRAARQAGFHEVEFWRDEVEKAEGGSDGIRTLAARIGLGFTDYQVLLDFDGAPGRKRDEKRAEALAYLDGAAAIGAPMLAVPASTDPDCDASRVREDLVWIVQEARRRNLRIGYEGMAWSTVNPTLRDAWNTIRDLDPEGIGLVLDCYHLFVRGGSAGDLDGIPTGRIAAVQFCDVEGEVAPQDYAEVARTRRLLPGDGDLPLTSLVTRLRAMNYQGPIGLEVFNDEMKRQEPEAVARRAFESLQDLLEG